MTDLEKGTDVPQDGASKKVSTTTDDVANILLYKNKFKLALEERFRDEYDVTERECEGNLKICVLAKGLEKKPQEQIVITITKTGKIDVKLNPYNHYDEYYFISENLTYEEVINEMDNFASFLNSGTVGKDSKLIKTTYERDADGEIDIRAYLPFHKYIAHILREELGMTCDITLDNKNGNNILSLCTKGREKKSEGQILITFATSGKITAKLNDYDHYEDGCYLGDGLTQDELINEMDNFKSFLQSGTVSKDSKLIKESYNLPPADEDGYIDLSSIVGPEGKPTPH
ncbi:MAG: hypothetical protein WC875_00285 [Candidatus Absconditabacterales bacterium]